MYPYLNNVSVLTSCVEKSLYFYQRVLGMRLENRFYQRGRSDVALLSEGGCVKDLCLELIGPPWPSWREESSRKRESYFGCFSFIVSDLDEWYRKLRLQEIEILIPPTHFMNVREMFFRDPLGLVIGMISFNNPQMTSMEEQECTSDVGVKYRVHHLSVTCGNISTFESFYANELGLKTVIDRRPGGNIFMADSFVVSDKDRSGPLIEVIDSSCWWEREQAIYGKYGNSIDHISFIVEDIDTAYSELVTQGVEVTAKPLDYGSNRIFFCKDPNGVEIEFQRPVLTQLLSDWRRDH